MNYSSPGLQSAFQEVSAFLMGHYENPMADHSFEDLKNKLSTMSLDPEIQKGIWAWSGQAVTRILPDSPIPQRILHQLESELLTSEAYGLLLKSLFSGITTPSDAEELIEDIAGKEPLPIQKSTMLRALTSSWVKELYRTGSTKVN